jgi:hypothetical protein
MSKLNQVIKQQVNVHQQQILRTMRRDDGKN